MHVPYSYLDQQFSDIEAYLEDIRRLVKTSDFTLGTAVREFEERFSNLCKLPYALGVASGTDALILSLRILGVKAGDDVITTPNTFIATVGAIVMAGARPVFVDCNRGYTIDVDLIEKAISPKTKAVLPVHLTGNPADMPTIKRIALKHSLAVVEDAAQAILASIGEKHVGSWGDTACFSLHPLKNLNVWGDGGVIVTRSRELYNKLLLFRNHGLVTRDKVSMFGFNSRLDSLQAVIGNRLIGQVHSITEKRISNAHYYDKSFSDLKEFITLPPRKPNVKQVFHTYVISVQDRDNLLAYLLKNGISAKIHYPIPIHLQEAAFYLGYKQGDFPVCEEQCRTIISLPVHQHLTEREKDYVIEHVRKFYDR